MKKIPYKTNQRNPQVREYRNAVERGMQSHHVLPRNGSWVVKRAGSPKASQIFNTQEEAKNYGISVSKNQGTALFIHGANGRIRDRKDY